MTVYYGDLLHGIHPGDDEAAEPVVVGIVSAAERIRRGDKVNPKFCDMFRMSEVELAERKAVEIRHQREDYYAPQVKE